MTAPASMTVFIPLTVRKTGGRVRIVPPAGMVPGNDQGVDPRVLKAIARAWSWRRRLESGEALTILDIAQAEGVTDRFVSRMIRLAWLSPAVLEKLVLERCPAAVSIKDIIEAADLPWDQQENAVTGQPALAALCRLPDVDVVATTRPYSRGLPMLKLGPTPNRPAGKWSYQRRARR